jgi:hypothetical protein
MDVNFILKRGAKSGKAWFPSGGVIHNEAHEVAVLRVL